MDHNNFSIVVRLILKALQHQTGLTFRSYAIDLIDKTFKEKSMEISAVSKKSFLGVILIASALALTQCRSKSEKPAEGDTSAATPTTSQESPAVDSTPMSFDAAGSDSGKISGLRTVNFDYDKATLSSSAKKAIQGNVEWMKSNPKTKVQIEGHTDSRGSIEYNVALGERRANSVKDYMISLGIAGNRLATISYGKEKPLASGENEEAWGKNRRANFVPSSL
jgi:peptidoglycan-associated lipoprotein